MSANQRPPAEPVDYDFIEREDIQIRLNAAYTDGHVEQFNVAKTDYLPVSRGQNTFDTGVYFSKEKLIQ